MVEMMVRGLIKLSYKIPRTMKTASSAVMIKIHSFASED